MRFLRESLSRWVRLVHRDQAAGDEEALITFDPSAEREHRTRRHFCKRTEILGAQFFCNRRDVFSASRSTATVSISFDASE